MRNLHDIGKFQFTAEWGDLNKFLDSFIPTSVSPNVAGNPTYFYPTYGNAIKTAIVPPSPPVKWDNDWWQYDDTTKADLSIQYSETRCITCGLKVYGILPRGKTSMTVVHGVLGGHTPEYM